MEITGRISTVFFLLLFACQGFAQVSFDSQADLEKAANSFFEAKEYTKAKPLFSQLLSKDALNPNYNYRFGTCIMFTESDPLKPVPYIEGGASTKGVNPEAHYYLGKVYQYNYRFDDAILAFQKGKAEGFSVSGIDLDKSIAECRNGKLLYNQAIEFKPTSDKEVMASEFYRPYDFRKLKGKVIPMPPTFKTKYDEKNLVGTVIYTPTSSEVLIYASYGEDGSNAKDLYRVNRMPNGQWSIPQRLPATINTKYDEDYAFFDEASQTLFFASKGHNTMGGYDVFSSKFDATKNSWTTPLNLQHPINSPFDDFLYVSDDEGKVAFFTSSRQTEEGKLKVFKTLLHDPSLIELTLIEGTFEDRTDQSYNYMSATVTDPKTNEVIGKYRSHKETGKYVLILPPQNDYVLDIGPREAEGFKFDLDVPVQTSVKPLQQGIVYEKQGSQGTVKILNYFDAAGQPDTVEFVVNRPAQEVEERMVAMPDASALLAERNEAKLKEQNAELARQKVAEAEALAKAEKERLELQKAQLEQERKAKEELALKEKEAQEQLAQAEAKQKEVELAAEQAKLKSEQDLAARLENEAKAKQELQQKADAEAVALAEERAKQEAKRKADEALAASKAEADAKEAELTNTTEQLVQKQDSISKAESVAVEANSKTDSEAALEAEAEERKVQELARLNQLAQERKQQVLAEAKRDSLERAELAQARMNELRTAIENARKDSLTLAGKRTLELKTEQERLAQIDEEVELAKRKALKDSVSYLEEMDEVVAAIEKNELIALAESDAALLEEKVKQEEVSKPIATESAQVENKTASESELFLATIAKLEVQKQEQQKLINAENEAKTQKQAEAAASAKAAELEKTNGSNADGSESSSVSVNNSETGTASLKPEAERELAVLKSDADPNDYLKELDRIEQQIAKEAASRPDKSYELKPLKPGADNISTDKTTDVSLQQTIDKDRAALAEHQRVAVEKERAMNEQMTQDKQMLEHLGQEYNKEVDAIEQEAASMLNETASESEQKPAPGAEVQAKPVAVETVNEEPQPELGDVSLDELDKEFEQLIQSIEAPKTETAVAQNTQKAEELASEKAVDAKSDQASAESKPADIVEVTKPSPVQPVEPLQQESVISDQKIEGLAAANPSLEHTKLGAEEETQVETNATELESAPVRKIATPDIAMNRELGVGVIPFLTAAERHPNSKKPSFENVADDQARRIIKRMRAEDIGRMAVLKNMKNNWVDAGRTAASLQNIQDNLRNQDVLASYEPSSREEFVRQPFDKNELKQRQDVYYKLEIKIATVPVSETISSTMNPEQAISFSMPEFDLSAEYYSTLADARSGFFEYRNRGFDKLRIVPYLKGTPVSSSDVENIPFVD